MASPSPRLLIPALSFANFTIGVGAFMVIGVLAPVAAELRMSEAEAGLVMTVYAVAYAIGSPLLVALTGGLRRRDLLAGALLLFAVAAAVIALAESAGVLLFGRALAALGAGIVSPVIAAVAAASVAPEARGRALAAAFFGFTLAQVMGIPLGAWVGYTFGWRVDFWAVAALSLLAAAGAMRFVPANVSAEPGRLSALFATLMDRRAMLALSFTPLFVGAAYVFYTFATPILETRMGMGREGVSLFLFVTGAGAVAGNLISGRLADRIGPAWTLGALSVVTILVTPIFSLLPVPPLLLYGATFLWSVFGWGFFAVQQNRLIAAVPERATVVLSLNSALLYLGVSLGSAAGSGLAAGFGLDALGWGAAAVATAALLNLVLVERALRRR